MSDPFEAHLQGLLTFQQVTLHMWMESMARRQKRYSIDDLAALTGSTPAAICEDIDTIEEHGFFTPEMAEVVTDR